jgi:hypothetical protein
MAIPFKYLPQELVRVLESHKITEDDLFNYQGDLYVGCKYKSQALLIKNSGSWKSCSDTFVPQKGSDMEKYPVAIDIGWAALAYDFSIKHPNSPEAIK